MCNSSDSDGEENLLLKWVPTANSMVAEYKGHKLEIKVYGSCEFDCFIDSSIRVCGSATLAQTERNIIERVDNPLPVDIGLKPSLNVMIKENAMNVSREMPRYECHKKVWALKIKNVIVKASTQEATIVPEDEGYAEFPVPYEYIVKHNPQAGGYYVVYQDGYKSFSPAEAFEKGYTLIS
jgi:hypothetical protein